MQRTTRPWVAKAVLRKYKARGIMLPDFKCHRAAVIKALWTWHKNMDQQSRREPRSNLTLTRLLLYDKGDEDRQWEESAFNKWHWKNWTPHTKLTQSKLRTWLEDLN